jgi:hypothetical protein
VRLLGQDDSLQHGSNRQRNLPFASRCLFGARASPAGAGGGGQDPSELEAPGESSRPGPPSEPMAPGEGSGPAASPELAAPGQGGVDGEVDVVGEGGEDIVKMP